MPAGRLLLVGVGGRARGGPAEEEPAASIYLPVAQLDSGPVAAMGVPRTDLPTWDHIQFVTAQLARLPLLDDDPVGTEVCIGPNAERPLWLDIPIFVSDMSFGALSEEAKTALARYRRLRSAKAESMLVSAGR